MINNNYKRSSTFVIHPYLYGAYRRGADHGQPITNHCDHPYRTATIDLNGNCLLCICDAWLPISVGNILEFDNLQKIWTNPSAEAIQQTIVSGEYTHCAVYNCGILDRSMKRPSYYINLAIDDSCNLACPSCRREARNYTSGEVFDSKLRQINHLVKLLENFDQPLEIILTGNGDPLASTIMRPLILDWQPKSNQQVVLFTNGLLMRKLMPQSPIFPHVSRFQISIDAGSAEVYEKVRAPGKFAHLVENLDWLHKNVDNPSKVVLKFVLSSMNVNDVENFSNFCKHYGFQGEITKLDDWATFDNFLDYDVVGNQQHADHNVARQQLMRVADQSHLLFGQTIKDFLCHKTTSQPNS